MFAMLLSLALVAGTPEAMVAEPADPISPDDEIATQMADNQQQVTADLARARMLDSEVRIVEGLMAMGDTIEQREDPSSE